MQSSKAKTYLLLHIATSALTAALVFFLLSHEQTASTSGSKQESAFERIMRTKTLRCGYVQWPPEFSKDVNTGQFSGIDYDIINEVALRLGLAVEWAEEVNFTTMSEGLKSNHYDSICFTLYRDSPRASWTEMTAPIFFSGHGVFVRRDDERFSANNLQAFNSPNITIAGVDGELSSTIARRDYPKAKLITLPQTSSPAELLMTLTSRKADVVFVNVNSAGLFDNANPGLIKNLDVEHPISFFSHAFAFNKGEVELKNMFDIVLEEMNNQGFITKILQKYRGALGGYYTVARPYTPLQQP